MSPYSEIWGLLSERGLYLGYAGRVLKVPAAEHEIGAALEAKNLRWKGYDAKALFKALNLTNAEVVWDGLLAAYVVRPSLIENFETIYELYCEKRLPDFCSSSDQMRAHLELESVLRVRLEEQEGTSVYERFDLPLVPVLAALELKGVRVDFDELKIQSKTLHEDIAALETKIVAAAGEPFNIGSPKQLGHILFEKLKLPTAKKTKTGFFHRQRGAGGLGRAAPDRAIDPRLSRAQ